MTPRTGNNNTPKQGIHQTPNRHYHNGPTTPTPSGEWLGLRADEGRGKPRYCPG
ncbi:hypothetical protein G4O51_10985 [Candidatus Bathyarchaeota archaeon A05DMB-2]|nr:hypothetical protein [Candidatus Bathyarchaeota archaeon A05DMB-2]